MKEEEVEHWRMKEEEEVEHWRLREKRSRTRRRQRKRRTSFTGVQVVQPVPKVQHSVHWFWAVFSIEMAFNMDSPFLHLSFVDSTCVLCIIIVSKWIPGYLRLFMCSMTSPLKETAGIACPTALLLRVHHRACALLGLILDSVSWHQCDTCRRTL